MPCSEVRSSSLLAALEERRALDLRPLGRRREHVDQGVLGCHHGVGHAEARVGPRREDPEDELLVPGPDDLEVEFDAFGSSDPVALHGLDPLGPVQGVERVEELVDVGGGAEEPLLELALDDQVTGALAGPVREDLLVGQDGLATRAPIDRSQSSVGEAGFEQPEEDDLVPPDVRGVVTPHLPSPVVDGAQALDAGLELGDAGLGEAPGMFAGADGGVFRRQAEGVETQWRQDGKALHGAVTHEQVPEGVVPDVALVGGPARVGVHAQDVLRRARVVGVDLVDVAVSPALLPLQLDFLDVIGPRHPWILRTTGTTDGASRPRSVAITVPPTAGNRGRRSRVP